MTKWCPGDHKWSRGHPKRHWQDDLEEAIGSNWSHVAQRSTLMDNKQRGVPPTGVKQNPENDNDNVVTLW